MSQSEHLGEQSKERHRQFLLLCATYALLASPFYVFASPRSGTANAVAHIAVGFLVVCLPYKLRPAIFSGRISAYLRRPAIACGFLVAIPYYFFEISSLGWLFAPRSETPLGFWSAPFADVFSFMGSSLGYWPLCISAAFFGHRLDSGQRILAHRQQRVRNRRHPQRRPKDHTRKPRPLIRRLFRRHPQKTPMPHHWARSPYSRIAHCKHPFARRSHGRIHIHG